MTTDEFQSLRINDTVSFNYHEATITKIHRSYDIAARTHLIDTIELSNGHTLKPTDPLHLVNIVKRHHPPIVTTDHFPARHTK